MNWEIRKALQERDWYQGEVKVLSDDRKKIEEKMVQLQKKLAADKLEMEKKL